MSRAEQPTQEIIVPDQREVVIAYLERERELWLPHHSVAKRANGQNAEANRMAGYHMTKIDRLLGELSMLDSAEVTQTDGRGRE